MDEAGDLWADPTAHQHQVKPGPLETLPNKSAKKQWSKSLVSQHPKFFDLSELMLKPISKIILSEVPGASSKVIKKIRCERAHTEMDALKLFLTNLFLLGTLQWTDISNNITLKSRTNRKKTHVRHLQAFTMFKKAFTW
jgi:hypothetical protein